MPPRSLCIRRTREKNAFLLDNANFSQAVSGSNVVRLRKSRVVEDSLPKVIHGAPLGHDNLSTGKPAVSRRGQAGEAASSASTTLQHGVNKPIISGDYRSLS